MAMVEGRVLSRAVLVGSGGLFGGVVGMAGTIFGTPERIAVDLAIGREWEVPDGKEGAWDHMGRQDGVQGFAQSGGMRSGTILGSQVGSKAVIPGLVFADDDDGLENPRLLLEDGFDFAELDAEAAQLYLVIDAAHVVKVASEGLADDVAGAIEAAVGVDGALDEPLRGELVTVQIASGDTVAADREFAGHAGRQQVPVLVEDVDLGVGDGSAD
jgi:hypothetical protein